MDRRTLVLCALLLSGCGEDATTPDDGTAKGQKTHAIQMAWDYFADPNRPDEGVSSFQVQRSRDCQSWQTVASNVLDLFFTDAAPFSWHQACYQVMAKGTLGDVSPPSNQIQTTW